MITTRKLNQVRNSYYVYLPREWCDEHRLDKNSEVTLERTQDGALHISPSVIQAKQTTPLKITIENEHRQDLSNLLIGAYIVGAGELELTFTDALDMATREEISKWVDKLEGWGILDEHSNSMLISDILTSDREVIRKVLKRQFATTKYMLQQMISSISGGDITDYMHIVSRDEQVDRNRYLVERLCHLVLRDPAYARKIALSPPDALSFSLAAKFVERLADHICGAVNEIMDIKKIDTKLVKLTTRISELYEKTTSVFFSIDKKGREQKEELTVEATEAFESLREANDLADSLSRLESSRSEKNPHEIILALHLERIASYCSDIIEIGINRIVEVRI
ncbi:MAG: phosphate uptake regulator PhoU [Candidatus Thorarchaeota archaeon]|nr:phosphate uptake regulator PhoU [Candidatus Thorarchaeota archaeon]